VHYLEHGDLSSADDTAERAYRQCRDMDMPGRALKCRVVQARVRVAGGDWAGALARIAEALTTVDRGRMTEDAVIAAVDLVLSGRDHVPPARLHAAVRAAWPHVSGAKSEALRPRVAQLEALLGIDETATQTGDGSTALPFGADNITGSSEPD
jgi:hypothetical protein